MAQASKDVSWSEMMGGSSSQSNPKKIEVLEAKKAKADGRYWKSLRGGVAEVTKAATDLKVVQGELAREKSK